MILDSTLWEKGVLSKIELIDLLNLSFSNYHHGTTNELYIIVCIIVPCYYWIFNTDKIDRSCLYTKTT